MREIFHQFELQIFAILGTLFVAVIRYFFRPRSRLVYSTPHSFTFLLQPEPPNPRFTVATTSVWLQNVGRDAATEVELTFNYKPQTYNLWPARHFEAVIGEFDRYTLRFQNFAPREFVQVEMMSAGQELPAIVSLRSKEGIATLITMQPMQVYSALYIYTFWLFVFVGVSTVLYLFLLLIVPHLAFLTQG